MIESQDYSSYTSYEVHVCRGTGFWSHFFCLKLYCDDYPVNNDGKEVGRHPQYPL